MQRFARVSSCLVVIVALCGGAIVGVGADQSRVEQAAFDLVKPASTTHGMIKLKDLVERNRAEVINARDKHDHTPLNMAAFWGNPEAARVLLAAGANPSNRDVMGRGRGNAKTRGDVEDMFVRRVL